MKKNIVVFGIIIAKTRGACVIARFWPNQEAGRDEDGLGRTTREVLLNRPCARVWAELPMYLYIISRLRCSIEIRNRV
jgi:hypothetical protein